MLRLKFYGCVCQTRLGQSTETGEPVGGRGYPSWESVGEKGQGEPAVPG